MEATKTRQEGTEAMIRFPSPRMRTVVEVEMRDCALCAGPELVLTLECGHERTPRFEWPDADAWVGAAVECLRCGGVA